MKIRHKLLIGFGFYIFFSAVIAGFAYRNLHTITERLVLVEIADDMKNTILEIRRYEKNFLLYREKTSFSELHKYLNALEGSIDNANVKKELGTENYHKMKDMVGEYRHLADNISKDLANQEKVTEILKTIKQEGEYTKKIRLKARDIEFFTDDLLKKERGKITETIKLSTNLFLFAILVILVLGVAVNLSLAASITIPITRLERATKKVAMGDFSEAIGIEGKDEIAALTVSFSQMQEKLKNTISSLEEALNTLQQKQEQILLSEKMASLGQLAAAVAHEINNPLSIINESTGLMKDIAEVTEDFPNKEKFLSLMEAIFNSVHRCSVITHRLLGFARKDITPQFIDLNDTAREAIAFLEKEILFKGIHLNLDLKDDLPKILTDKGQLQQVLLNIIKNALDVVDTGGTIAVATKGEDKDMVSVSITDNGSGIPPDKLRHVFEPFYTTKLESKGTGLGLYISYEITKRLGGKILVESKVGVGTTFTLKMPIETELIKGE